MPVSTEPNYYLFGILTDDANDASPLLPTRVHPENFPAPNASNRSVMQDS